MSTSEVLRSHEAVVPEVGLPPADLARVTQSPLCNADLALPAAVQEEDDDSGIARLTSGSTFAGSLPETRQYFSKTGTKVGHH